MHLVSCYYLPPLTNGHNFHHLSSLSPSLPTYLPHSLTLSLFPSPSLVLFFLAFLCFTPPSLLTRLSSSVTVFFLLLFQFTFLPSILYPYLTFALLSSCLYFSLPLNYSFLPECFPASYPVSFPSCLLFPVYFHLSLTCSRHLSVPSPFSLLYTSVLSHFSLSLFLCFPATPVKPSVCVPVSLSLSLPLSVPTRPPVLPSFLLYFPASLNPPPAHPLYPPPVPCLPACLPLPLLHPSLSPHSLSHSPPCLLPFPQLF